MTPLDVSVLALLVIIAAEVTYLTYRSHRQPISNKKTQIFVDTSVLMDGRILPIAQAGFIPGVLVIPRSVVGELQLLADGGDSERRERARRGLDSIKELQAVERIDVRILQDGSRADEGVDERLLTLAKRYSGIVCTIDFNLNKVAQVEGIAVLNINELAQKLRMSYLPGDHMQLSLTHAGSDAHQAVGHLDDGTMVVVEHAKAQIGKTAEIEIIRSLQTAAGRMMFARLVASKTQQPTTPKKQQNESRGRRKVPSGNKPKPEQIVSTSRQSTQAVQASPKKIQQPSKRNAPARKDRESTLIELVNNQ